MLIKTLKTLFNRDLRQLKNKIINKKTLDNFDENLLNAEYPTDESGKQLSTNNYSTKK